MQITVFQTKQTPQKESPISDMKIPYESIFPQSVSGQIMKILQNGYRITDFLFLGDTRDILRNIRLNLNSLEIDNSQLLIFSFYQMASHIFRNYDFLVNKKNHREISRCEQLEIIKKICFSQNHYSYYKNISLYIVYCKMLKIKDFQKYNFVSFMKSKCIFESNDYDMSQENSITNENELNEFAQFVLTQYQETLNEKHLIDCEDLIYYATQILVHNTSIVSFYRRKYKSIFINCKDTFATNKEHIKNFIQILFFGKNDSENNVCFIDDEVLPALDIINTSAEVSDIESDNPLFSPQITTVKKRHNRNFCYHELFSDEIVDYFSDYDNSDDEIYLHGPSSSDEESGILEQQTASHLSESISKKNRLNGPFEANGSIRQRRFSYYGQNSIHFFDEMRSNLIKIANSHTFFSDDCL